jgi:hypothetical protein
MRSSSMKSRERDLAAEPSTGVSGYPPLVPEEYRGITIFERARAKHASLFGASVTPSDRTPSDPGEPLVSSPESPSGNGAQ